MESEGELYGLALMLHNTEDAAKKSCDLTGLPDKERSDDHESIRGGKTEGTSENKDEDCLKCCQKINRSLIIYKSFYFFFFSAVGSLFPYLAVFYKQLWLSAHETGILIGIRPLIQLFGTPMWGIIADTYKKSKLIFVVSLVAWLVSNYSLSLVSPVFHLGVCSDNATLAIIQEIMKEMKNRTIPQKNNTNHHGQFKHKPSIAFPVNSGNSSNHWFEIIRKERAEHLWKRNTGQALKHRIQNKVNIALQGNYYANIMHYLKDKADSTLIFKSGIKHVNRFLDRSKFHTSTPPTVNSFMVRKQNVYKGRIVHASLDNNQRARNRNRLIATGKYFKLGTDDQRLRRASLDKRALMSKSDILKLLRNSSSINENEFYTEFNSRWMERVFDSLNMAGEYPWPLDTVASYDSTQEAREWLNPHDRDLFTILFVITATGTLIAAPAITLADTATLQNLGNRPEDYGKQRLWGAFGWGIAAFIVGSSLSTIEELSNCNNPLSVDYLPCFYAFACLMGVTVLIGALFEFDEKESHESSIWKGLSVLCDCQNIYFIFTILFCGSALGFIETFLFWHLQDLGGTQFLFSTITAIHCISEVAVYCCSGTFIKWLGHHQVLYVGLSCYIIRFFGYALITNCWVVLPFEILHGLSTAAVWSAAVVFVGLIPGAPATMQGILGGVHWGLGNGGGGVLGGLLITYAGATTSFLIFGVISLVDLSLFILLNNMEFFNCFEWSKGIGTQLEDSPVEDETYKIENLEPDYDDLY
ncbi:major facilitator superfamily domain-containing protein 6-like [Stylophora pistillata]|uniref:major facilitator superfamily domain-containing protein 6-like n=1 Tax=Stylophora pistillata TaxID=50429 RepID=UPI000C0476DA|nr:major facilitator superfamily domain-containing protein 6-like [Stylophora pistillata]